MADFLSEIGYHRVVYFMDEIKDTLRARVRIGYDGRVYKEFRGPQAHDRFSNEACVLRYLAQQGCGFVPRLIEADEKDCSIVTTNCGRRVEHIAPERLAELFAEVETYGVRHNDPDKRNVTYRASDGRFCVIDFEFATILHEEKMPTAPEPSHIQWTGHTDRGKIRAKNEDSFLCIQSDSLEVRLLGKVGEAEIGVREFVFAVSDGMGGENAGEFASRIVIEKTVKFFQSLCGKTILNASAHLETLFQEIHKALHFLGSSYEECAGMGATLTLCWLRQGILHFAHLGDSRLYYRNAQGSLAQLTHDHTHAGWLLRTGKIAESEARRHPSRHSLQQALGEGYQFITPQIGQVDYVLGDCFLLCSDGVSDAFSHSQISDILATAPTATDIVACALAAHTRDNTSALVVRNTNHAT